MRLHESSIDSQATKRMTLSYTGIQASMIFKESRNVIKGGVLISLTNGKGVDWKTNCSQRDKVEML